MHVLQSMLRPPQGFPDGLYLRLAGKHRERTTVAVGPESAGIELSADEVLSTDTFFGSFYRAYWQTYCDLPDLTLRIRLEGAGRIRVVEDFGRGTVEIRNQSFDHPSPTVVDIPLSMDLTAFQLASDASGNGRLFVEIEAEQSSRVFDISFGTSAAPKHNVSLSIGLCTFNQEARLTRTLARLAAFQKTTPELTRVFVINQGKPFESEEILEELDAPIFATIEQRNLGGCGGFTRSLYEAAKTEAPATHHLLMDDDIVLDERLIARAMTFLAYRKDEIAVGAGMIDLLKPTVMFEFGATLSNDNKITRAVHDIDLATPGNLHHFNTVVRSDFNAWWFCIVPLASLADTSLPNPVFIRGDDFEFGQRLARHGVPTVTLPGIGVWHEPFYAKPTGWQDYYDLRNQLIFGATYPEKVSQLSVAHVGGRLMQAVLTHNYTQAELCLKSVEDFLAGPDAVFGQDGEALHQSVMALAKADPPARLENAAWESIGFSKGWDKATNIPTLLAQFIYSAVQTALLPHRRVGTRVLKDADCHPVNTGGRGYVMSNGLRTAHLKFEPRRSAFFGLCRRAIQMTLRYRSEHARAGRKWNDSVANYQSTNAWETVFQIAAE